MVQTSRDVSALNIQQNVSSAALSTLNVGGRARWFARVTTINELEQLYSWAQKKKLPVLYLGEGSNVLFPDDGFDGLIIQNGICGRERSGNEIQIGGGENLGEIIRWCNGMRLSGLERMYGIPGTLAGAIVGNAGAYGQEIGDSVVEVLVWTEGGLERIPASDLDFRYRHSRFKDFPSWFILSCRLRLSNSDDFLQAISEEILSKRSTKYPPALKCPGSFFKNVVLDDLSRKQLEKIPDDFIMFGKIPAGKLLEAVGAKGARRGEAQFADYHANLIVNLGNACSEDLLSLANEYAGRVWDDFAIRLEPEILILGDERWPYLRKAGRMKEK